MNAFSRWLQFQLLDDRIVKLKEGRQRIALKPSL
jgi:hypothetical protein